MKKTKIALIVALVIFLLFGLTAYLYTYKISDYSNDGGFLYHIFSEEYDENYSEHTETLALEKNTDYKIEIEATCQSGTIELTIHYADGTDKNYTVNVDTPYSEVIEIPRNTADEIKITVSYDADTDGVLIGKILTHRHYFLI